MGFFNRRSTPSFSKDKRERSDLRDSPWRVCPECDFKNHILDLAPRFNVCSDCDYHFKMNSRERIEMLVDQSSFEEFDAKLQSINVLDFKGYTDKLKGLQEETGMKDAVVTGRATFSGHRAVIAVMDSRFLGGSMGSVVGEKITRAIETATAERCGVIVVSASGGARMHEGILSLMQMAKTSGALARHSDARLPYISVMTDPTTGGVTASFAALGDVIIAEPKCMIGFAGPRVVKETTHQNLPEGFQTAEFMLEHGLVDRITHRGDMRDTLTQLLRYMQPAEVEAA